MDYWKIVENFKGGKFHRLEIYINGEMAEAQFSHSTHYLSHIAPIRYKRALRAYIKERVGEC